MAKADIPNPLERRHLVERELSNDQAEAIADAYLAEERTEEAVVVLAKAGAQDRLRALWSDAAADGNVFLLREIARLLDTEPSPALWERVAEAARTSGKHAYAEAALRQAPRSDD